VIRRPLVTVLVVAVVASAAIAQESAQGPSAPAPQAGAPSQRPPSFRSGVDVVSLNVTVADNMGRYVTDLQESDFQVFESGVKQDLTFFNRRQSPITVALLLDSSASMENKLPTLQTAAVNFVRRLKPDDLAEVIDFDGTTIVRQTFTGNHEALEKGIQQMIAGGSTALHNAIYVALNELRKVQTTAEEEPRRQALIVFSDGEDTSSIYPFDEVLDRAKRSDTAIYTIGLRDAQDHIRGFRQAEYVLRQLAMETGGRAFFPGNISELDSVYTQIADELSNQYALGYTSKNPKRDGAWRPIVVQVTRANTTSRTKRGYFAPTSSSR
jgi:Ca-activated chloride channel family protein